MAVSEAIQDSERHTSSWLGSKKQGNGGKRMEVMKKLLATMLMPITHPLYC